MDRTPVRSVADIDGAQAIAERGEHRAGHVASLIDAADIADAAEVVVMEAPAATPQPNGIAEAAVGASAMVLSEAAATSPT